MADLLTKKEPYISTLQLKRGGSFLFFVVLAVFFVMAASSGGLALLNKAQSAAQETLWEEVRGKEGSLRTELLAQIFLIEQRLRNLRLILAEHVFTSNVLRLLEQETLPQVRFLNFNFDAASRKLDMTGEAASYSILARQIGVLERNPNIERVEFGGLAIGGNNLAGFKLTLIFKKSLLLLRP